MIDPTGSLLGRLERVELRQSWFGEVTDFTPPGGWEGYAAA